MEEPRADEVRERVVGVGVWHTDFSVRDQFYPVPLPAVLGARGCRRGGPSGRARHQGQAGRPCGSHLLAVRYVQKLRAGQTGLLSAHVPV
jgi:hypothetical protein